MGHRARARLAAGALAVVSAVLLLGGCTLRGHDFCAVKADPGSAEELIQFFVCESDEYGSVIQPRAAFSIADNPTRSGTPVTFNAAGSGGSFIYRSDDMSTIGHADIVNYRWDLDGDSSNGYETDTGGTPTAQHSYDPNPERERQVPVGLRVTDAAGLHDEARLTVTVRDPDDAAAPSASFIVDPPSPNVGQTVRFDGSASSDPNGDQLTYRWDLDGSITGDTSYETPTGTRPTVETQYNQPGSVTVGLEVSDFGGLVGSTTRTFTVRPFEPTRGASRPDGGREAVGSPGERRLAAPAKRSGRRFTARFLGAELIDSGAGLERDGELLEAHDVTAKGRIEFRYRSRSGARRKLSSAWTAELDLSIDLADDERRASGIAVLDLPGRGRSCVRLALRSGKGDRLVGGFRVAGAKRSGGSFRAKPGSARIGGRLKPGRGGGGRIAKPCRGLAA